MLRTLFIEEARTQVGRNASVTGACCLVLLGFLGLWWLLADVPAPGGRLAPAAPGAPTEGHGPGTTIARKRLHVH